MYPGMPEEVALAILSHALDCAKDRTDRHEDPVYPIVRMQVYGRSEDRWGRFGPLHRGPLWFGAQSGVRPVGKTSGSYRDLYFKVFPRGTCSIPGYIVGFPVLDAGAR